MQLTEEENNIITHTLTGSSPDGRVYRNYFAASKGHHDEHILKRLVEKEAMKTGQPYGDQPGGFYYCATEAGASAVGLHLPRPDQHISRA
jgi:hypothetical protein